MCFVCKSQNCESAITESTEARHFPNVTASPGIVTLTNPRKTSRVPVTVCNMSAMKLCYQLRVIYVNCKRFTSKIIASK